MGTQTCTREDCDNEIDMEKLRRVHGEYSSVVLGRYCSAQCYTAEMVKGNNKPPTITLTVEVPKSKLDAIAEKCDERTGGNVSVESYISHAVADALKGIGLSINYSAISIKRD